MKGASLNTPNFMEPTHAGAGLSGTGALTARNPAIMSEHYGPKSLWATVLRQAVEDVCGSREDFAYQALSWMCADNYDKAGSFLFVCTTLGVDPQRVRRMVLGRLWGRQARRAAWQVKRGQLLGMRRNEVEPRSAN